ncbi:hypothetical protein C8J57DRAFT_1504530 [Mycena rebaudengoi]|nr:hypothetical protein C8J57DRAFT_1504530 [Mycena rebaudengoi]
MMPLKLDLGPLKDHHRSLSWSQGKVYGSRTVQTSHAVLPDGCSWHSRSGAHSLPFDQFWSVLGHQWMPAKKAFNDEYIHEIEKVTLIKTLSSTTSIWTLQHKFPPPLSPRVFTILQVTRLDEAYPRIEWVVHLPIDLTGPGDEALLAQKGHGIKGRYACVEKITQLLDGCTEWRLVTSSPPAVGFPSSLRKRLCPPGSPLMSSASSTNHSLSLAIISWGLILLNVAVYASVPLAVGRKTPGPCDPRCHLGPSRLPLYLPDDTKPGRDIMPKTDRLLIGIPGVPLSVSFTRVPSFPASSSPRTFQTRTPALTTTLSYAATPGL